MAPRCQRAAQQTIVQLAHRWIRDITANLMANYVVNCLARSETKFAESLPGSRLRNNTLRSSCRINTSLSLQPRISKGTHLPAIGRNYRGMEEKPAQPLLDRSTMNKVSLSRKLPECRPSEMLISIYFFRKYAIWSQSSVEIWRPTNRLTCFHRVASCLFIFLQDAFQQPKRCTGLATGPATWMTLVSVVEYCQSARRRVIVCGLSWGWEWSWLFVIEKCRAWLFDCCSRSRSLQCTPIGFTGAVPLADIHQCSCMYLDTYS